MMKTYSFVAGFSSIARNPNSLPALCTKRFSACAGDFKVLGFGVLRFCRDFGPSFPKLPARCMVCSKDCKGL